MLRNDLITLVAEHDNDSTAVEVNGLLVDIAAVSVQEGSIVLRLDPEGLAYTLDRVVSGTRPSTESTSDMGILP